MMATQSAATAATISQNAARFAIATIVTYQGLLFLLIFLRPDLDPSWHTISEWARGPYGWVMSTGFLISALSYAALFVTLRSHLRGAFGRIGQGMLLACVIGTIGVGIFTTDPLNAKSLSTTGLLHIVSGTTALVLLPFAALFINLSLALRNAAWLIARRTLLGTGGLPLFGFATFALYTAIRVAPLGPDAYGPGVNIGWPPRFAFFTYMVWLVTVGRQAIRCAKQRNTETHFGR